MNKELLPDIILTDYLDKLDIFIVLFFIGIFLILPRLTAKHSAIAPVFDQEFLLMSHGLSLPLFVATLTSTWYGGIFGVTQIAFNKGIYSFFTQGLFWYFSYAIFALFFAKKIRQKQVLSLPELLGNKFGLGARKISAMLLFVHALPVTYAISCAILLQMILNLSMFQSLLICVLVVSIYTSLGGFRGVVVTDCLQFILMYFAVIILSGFLLYNFGLEPLFSPNIPKSHFKWDGDFKASLGLMWFFIATTSTLTHPAFYQRCLAAKSDSVAIKGIFVAIFFWLIFDICTTTGGIYARALLPEADSSKAYLYLGIELLPTGLRGLFLAGIISTILSTMDSFLFVSGTSLSYDILHKKYNNSLAHHRIAIGISAISVIFLASYFGTNFEEIWLFLEGMLSGTIFMPVLAAVFSKKTLPSFCFYIPSLSAFFVFIILTFLKLKFLDLEPFYLSHLSAFSLFLTCLYIHAKSQTKVPILTN